MLKVSVYDFKDYKVYIEAWLKNRPGKGRGEKSRFAQVLKCNTGYMSQILNGGAHLSLEQAVRLSEYLEHDPSESHFFLLLVQISRAGNRELNSYFQSQIDGILANRKVLKHRLEFQKTLTSEDQATYYANWYYTAIDILITIPSFKTPELIAKHLGLPKATVTEAIHFLVSCGMVIEEGGRYQPGVASMHLGEDSKHLAKHHTNWRLKAIQSFENKSPHDLHYTSVASLSRAELPRVREALVKAIEEVRSVVKESIEEEAVCYLIDVFRV